MHGAYLTPAEWDRLHGLRAGDLQVAAVLMQLERILASAVFQRVQQKARDFLAYVVAKTLLGQADQIKEMTIAMAVFGEPASFDATQNAKVRVAAADLRRRLTAYAARDGRRDVLQMQIPLNTYVPDLCDQRVAVDILEFENWHPHGDQVHLCEAVTAELAYQLETAGLRAGRPHGFAIRSNRSPYALRGSIESREAVLRINVSLADPATGCILCSRSFEGPRDDVFKLTREVTAALLDSLPASDLVPVQSRRRGP